jgi:LacI family transcriptional regulator
VGDELEPQGYQIVISNSLEQAERELQQIRLLAARSVDGLIIASAVNGAAGSLVDALTASGTRYVLIDRTVKGLKANFVGADDEGIGFLATSHLIEQGCRRIAHIRGPAISTGTGRLRGYRRALEKHGLTVPPEYIVTRTSGEAFEDTGGYAAMQRLLQLKPCPDGVVCYNDPVATGAIKAILQAGLNVPHDLAVIGAGNVHYSDLLRVPLSTMDQSSILIGQTAASLLVNSIESKVDIPPQRILLPPRLVVRESSQRKP